MTYSEILGKRIISLCNKRKWSINLVATLADLPHSTVNKIVLNQHHNPSIITIHAISRAFDMSITEFLNISEINDLTLADLNEMKKNRNSSKNRSDA